MKYDKSSADCSYITDIDDFHVLCLFRHKFGGNGDMPWLLVAGPLYVPYALFLAVYGGVQIWMHIFDYCFGPDEGIYW